MNNYKIIATLTVLVLASACSDPDNDKGYDADTNSNADITRQYIDAAKEAIKAQLIDPDSVRYRNIIVDTRSFMKPVVCGEVNAKNRLGGYSGFQPFIYNGPIKRAVKMDPSSKDISGWCSDAK